MDRVDKLLLRGEAGLRRMMVGRLLPWAAGLAVLAASALIGHALTFQFGLDRLRDAAQHRLDIVAVALEGEQARFDYLPALLEMTPNVFRLLDAPGDLALRDEVNRYLHGINATAGAANLYVLDNAGRGLAASDWNDPGTPIGTDLSFRPYVQEALAHGRGRFYGVGITSARAGYYLSYALYAHGRQRGVATVKVDFEKMEGAWSTFPGIVMLLDQRGVVILSSRNDWRFRPLAPLTHAVLADIAKTLPYGRADLLPLEWKVQRHLAEDADIVRLAGTNQLVNTRRVNKEQWRLLVLDDTAPVEAAARLVGITSALGVSVLWLLSITLWQRQHALRQKVANRDELQAAHDSLESKVAVRTTELRSANIHLKQEVETRKTIEADLRATQNELVHAGKMAVLGQMSAGLVHELNQPLGALRTLSDNACVLLDQDRLTDVRGNLHRIAHVVDRLGRLTSQLKVFAHKASIPTAPVEVQPVIADAQFMVSQRLRDQGVELEVVVRPAHLAALAEEARLEQVLVNLLANAIDAMAASPVRRLLVEAQALESRCVIAVSDSGPGIPADVVPWLFEPFTTTKAAGAGLGLGLMISAHIVRELGGTLRASNLDEGGARFVIELPLATTQHGLPG